MSKATSCRFSLLYEEDLNDGDSGDLGARLLPLVDVDRRILLNSEFTPDELFMEFLADAMLSAVFPS